MRFSGLSSISSSMPSSRQRTDLVVGAVQVVEGNADLRKPARRGVSLVVVAVAGDVNEVTVLVPAPDRVDGIGVGHAGENRLFAVRLLDAEMQLVAAQARDAPVQLLLVGQVDPEAAQRSIGEAIPVVVQRGVDVDGDAHVSRGSSLPSSVDPSPNAIGAKGWAHHPSSFASRASALSNTPASWFCPAVYELPRWHGVALAIADRPGLDVQSLELTRISAPSASTAATVADDAARRRSAPRHLRVRRFEKAAT